MMSVNRLSSGLMDLTNNSVREIALDSIIASDIKDRIALDDPGIQDLARAIAKHGQIVPIMVRPLPDRPDRYQIIYGRRRLAAIRQLDQAQTIKAIIRHVKDEDAVIAQGQENNLRLDPSYIEKALFARSLQEQGFDITTIGEALNIDRYSVSKFIKVAEDTGEDVISLIGAAHEIGRRPWRELGDLVQSFGPEAAAHIAPALEALDDSNDRFRTALTRLKAAVVQEPDKTAPKKPAKAISARDFRLVGKEDAPQMTYRGSSRQIALSIERTANKDFTDWLDQNIDQIAIEIQQRWKAARQP
ncbi:plasmid partitioning protein RepB [Falsigemmobacter faecalis]|nr:plasmid partitioning protein RepB [Falsigemmobacter faecalis]